MVLTTVETSLPAQVIEADPEAIELRLLLQSVFEKYGIDFREYAYSSLKRRVMRRVFEENTGTISRLREKVLSDPAAMDRLQTELTIHVTAMFRDPEFFLAFREQAIPALQTYPYLRLWIAGCSTGEEVYSLAILLHEAGLSSRCRLYATDVSATVLDKAKAGIFPLAAMQSYTRNYQQAGGERAFAEYYTADSDSAIFRPFLRENVIFAAHNLVGDASFNEFHAIFCRNVMIYFNRALQDRVHTLFYDSLLTYGYLGLGRSETMRFTSYECCYEPVAHRERLYRKIK
jgi:chemotaxis protein methyltransferase CheR